MPTHFAKTGILLIFLFILFGLPCGLQASGANIKSGISLYEAAEFEKSKAVFEKLIQKKPEPNELQTSYICLTMIEIAFGRTDSAQNLISKLLEAFPAVGLEELKRIEYLKDKPHLISEDFDSLFKKIRASIPIPEPVVKPSAEPKTIPAPTQKPAAEAPNEKQKDDQFQKPEKKDFPSTVPVVHVIDFGIIKEEAVEIEPDKTNKIVLNLIEK